MQVPALRGRRTLGQAAWALFPRGAAVALVLLPLGLVANAQSPEKPLQFNRDIRPILSQNCFQCHGFDPATREAGLRLDEREAAVDPERRRQAIVPGDPEASELVRRVLSPELGVVMPPPSTAHLLTEEQKAKLQRWIAEGAEYEPHWAYLPPTRAALPKVANIDWPRNAVDHFILAQLESEGVQPSPRADRATLIRRLSFDLLGLPPSPAETRAFLKDERPGAWERLVERMLASPHFGERLAVDWLDIVRYADTNGYHGDEHRNVYPYRDYVIQAFNENKPFDVFTREQIGGDLLPDAGREQQVAAAYNRLGQLTAEGGAQADEYLAKYAADRVRTFSTAWMGSTVGCAECHDHKFDPFSARDFYSMAAFFADVEERGVYSAGGRWDPILHLPTEEQEAKLARLDAEIARLEKALETPTPELAAARAQWERQVRGELEAGAPEWKITAPSALEARHGTVLEVQEDGSVLATGENPETEIYEIVLPAAALHKVTGIRLEALPDPSFSDTSSRAHGNFVLTGFEVELNQETLPIGQAVADFEQPDYPLANALDGRARTGWAVSGHADRKGEAREAVFTFESPVRMVPEDTLVVRLKHESGHLHHVIGRFRLSLTGAESPRLPASSRIPAEILAILDTAPEDRSEEALKQLAAYHRGVAPELDATRGALAEAKEQHQQLYNELPYTLATVAVEPREIRVLPRGDWLDTSGEVVGPATPAFLPALHVEDRRPTRLDLAEWLFDEANPLTARTYVNRLWAQFFRTGLSRVLDDLGSQGEVPSHPELLDWLAVEFRESGWDIKHMVRLIVNSEAYKQSSLPREELRDRDPFNRMVARQARFRLEAEYVRDNALAISGLLSDKVGGRSVFPYQPDGYWANTNTFTGELIYHTDTGEDQYRRGLYTYWKRSFLHPSMLAFDAPNREECVAERPSSNTPLQALVLLNDPTYVEAARAFAARIHLEGGEEFSDRVSWAFQEALSRTPTADEILLLANLYIKHRNEYLGNGEAAKALLSVGQATAPEGVAPEEIAAWTSVARVILNLHETITRT